ncbi:hypothetical protein pdam_00021376 [Pocillopora damicornis]|uniref:Uncharacterized protein n=1 Tax=Pocillopora damicornis TaxID=46731 RepID=A0A3M6TEU1_POCDA|nr:hypothetical protein pdam_00021376 [Pocillopora damicornis]
MSKHRCRQMNHLYGLPPQMYNMITTILNALQSLEQYIRKLFHFVSTIADARGDEVRNVYLLLANAMCNDRQTRIPCLSRSTYSNHVRRTKDYKTYWRALNKCGLWKDPVYQARKVELGDHVNAVRERMPNCVIKDVDQIVSLKLNVFEISTLVSAKRFGCLKFISSSKSMVLREYQEG